MANPDVMIPSYVLDHDRLADPQRYFYRFAIPMIPPPTPDKNKLVDIGCGRGELCAVAQKMGWNVTGVDGHASNVESLRAIDVEGVLADLNRSIPLPDNSRDCAVMVEVIEHIPMAEELMAEISRVLKPGGLLVMTTPNNAFYSRRLRALFGRAPDCEGYHFRFWTKKQLQKKFAAKNLHIVRNDSFGYFPAMNWLLLRRLPGRQRLYLRMPGLCEKLFAKHFAWVLENRKP